MYKYMVLGALLVLGVIVMFAALLVVGAMLVKLLGPFGSLLLLIPTAYGAYQGYATYKEEKRP